VKNIYVEARDNDSTILSNAVQELQIRNLANNNWVSNTFAFTLLYTYI